MKLSHQSEYGRIKSIYIKKVSESFVDRVKISEEWRALNYLEEPDIQKAEDEYSTFEKLINQDGAEISYFLRDESLSMDSMYCRDASIATDFGIILCNMGKAGRKNEPAAVAKVYKSHNVNILGTIGAPGTLEGGDVAWINQKTLAVGRTYRTNEEGIRQLRGLLEPNGVDVLQVDLPHYKGEEDVFHLMSIFSPVDKDLAVVYSPLMPIVFREYLIEKGYELVEVPDKEFESMGCNVLATAPGECIMVEGNPETKRRLEQAGANVQMYKGNEISLKGGGGPTCLTRPMLREIGTI